ncbi:kinase-like protein [Armillaria mellea]|nr:kinase-like protein [Armillaria mellea]
MATLLISQHSSNPLEAASSDPRNTRYRRVLNEARARQVAAEEDPSPSSEDQISGYAPKDDMHAYWGHLAQVTPVISKVKQKYGRRAAEVTTNLNYNMVDLDDNIDSDDPLALKDEPMEFEDEVDGASFDEESGEEQEERDDEDNDSQSSHVNDSDEEFTILSKSEEDRQEILEEIRDLEDAVPELEESYRLVDRLGTGTFSSVYKAVDLFYDKWDNRPWQCPHPSGSSAHSQSVAREPGSKVFVAIKRIYVTSSPERIKNEISVLEDCRGCRHVSQLITAFREKDQVVAIMPYQRNEDFRDFFSSITMVGIKAYFRCLMRALRDIHARQIIHRDVKPANFLFDAQTGMGTLCDFGLASRMNVTVPGLCLHLPASPSHPHGRLRARNEYDAEHIKKMQREARAKNHWPSDRVGYPQNDTRHNPDSHLLTGIDVWSAGSILLFFLTKKFPLFQSNDDVEALMEIATVIGSKRMEKVATLHSKFLLVHTEIHRSNVPMDRTFSTNVPSVTGTGMAWREFCEKQNPEIDTPPQPNPDFYPHADTPTSEEEHLVHRITPRDALYHPFLAESIGDDEFFPHPFGEGVCAHLHRIDGVTEQPSVVIETEKGQTMKLLEHGQGLAIGNQPCEFHQDLVFL